jgi:hypothetical protein
LGGDGFISKLNHKKNACEIISQSNCYCREKLGMPAGSPVCVDGILAQRKKEQLLMKVLQQQAERLEEEKLQLKLEVRQWLKWCRL